MKLPIIQTKLRVPAVKENFIRRARLTQKMKKIAEYPLTIIHSGAGFGKSTALALFITDEKLPGCWYSISSMDDDVLPFLWHIIHSVRSVAPEFGKELSAYIETIDHYIREEEIGLLCSLFINEINELDADVTLILDDFHQIEHSYTINSWMEKLLEHIPPNLHLVISSRSRPVWKYLTKMKVCGQFLEITREDLILTMDEMELLMTDLYGLTVESSHVQTIYQLTEGWVIAICMIAQQIPLKKDIADIFEHSSQSLQDFFQYLVMEVFSKQPPIVQQFLEQASIFEEIEEAMCEEVIGLHGAAKMLEQLKDRNLFIQKVGGTHYRFHALFKEFLENLLKNNQPENYYLLHERCARYFEKRQLWEEALHHYKKIEHNQAIAAILQEQGLKMLEGGKLESLSDQLTMIPEANMDIYYPLWYLKAEIHRYRSQYQQAENCYHRSFCGAEKKQDHLGMSMALEGKAKIYLDTIQPHQAERILYEAITHREKSRASDEEKGRLYQLLSENLLNAGKASEAEKWIQKTKAIDLDGNLEARLYLRTGRFEEAKRLLYRKKEQFNATNFTSLPQAHRETDVLLSLIEAFTGNGLRAKELAEKGIQQGITQKAPFVEACGWMRLGHAVQILNKYDSRLAENCYQTALEIMDQLHVDRGKAEPLMGLCRLYGIRGELERALDVGNKALLETEKVNDVWLSALITLGMGITCIYNERLTKAHHFLKKTDSLFQHCEDSYGQMLSKFWLSYLFFLEKKEELFKQTIDEFLTLVQNHEYEFFFYHQAIFSPRDLQVIVPLLITCLKVEIQTPFVRKTLENLGVSTLDSHPGYSLRVQTLGQFRLWLGEKEIAEKDWQREKAKELFQLFITLNEPIAKDEIIQILWPNQDKKNADRDFKVALNSLLHVLEPQRKARAASFFIIREGMFYGLNPHAVIEVDTTQFQKLIEEGLNATDSVKVIDFLKRGLNIYHGDYLPERRYEDWCISKRENLLVYFLRGAEKMAQVMVRRENYDAAIAWCEKILDRDRTWEEAYRLLMYCYYRKNNRPQAMKWYQKCVRVLQEELGVIPLEPTQHMYKMIIEAENFIDSFEQP
ncbi:BTAD domain-containing putative transcriptional regulator [Neobacillus sp. OS1-32]|uniref:BTAD domain-containing putative transcriptional regulator n=1 Tax=Neobacillus sp. OS1-32 TaxID=3070682 RepID=UPI0027E1EA27|nr:BTAD domain-containing putative transcriptional regulator [Neobacillus sp. OS1-32]WML30348.1 BTAD domain-containing putative transcriptional regulator [Neobacillus sp. OS1-32]